MSRILLNLIIATLFLYTPSNSFVLGDYISETVNKFFEDNLNRIKETADSSYENAAKEKTKFDNYIENGKQRIVDEYNNQIESVKASGRRFLDTVTFMPTEDPKARLENPDLVLSVPAIITRNGYVCETHTVISQGYLLNVHRIPRAKNGGTISKKTVLLQHGLFASSADWIMNGPEKSLAYILADLGYDVWMTNIRGNRYSREHAWYKQGTKEYWNFSWEEVAYFDIPAIIDYIEAMKGKDNKIAYIGHSMGTTILFTMLSLRPEYNDKLIVGVALAPEIFISNMKSPMKSFASVTSNFAHAPMLYGSYEYIPKSSYLGQMDSMCKDMDNSVCDNILFYLCGEDEEQFNKSLLPVFMSNLGTGTSLKTAVHMSQMILSGKFQRFDYGFADSNQRIYGTDVVPEYDLSKVTLKVNLFWAQNDLLSSEEDVRKLHEQLPYTTSMYMVPHPKFNHIDYLLARDAKTLVNDKVLEILIGAFDSDEREVIFRFRLGK